MKKISVKIAIALLVLTANQATAQGKSSNDNTLLSFNIGNPNSGNAKLIIRNSNNQVVKIKSITTNYCNVEKSLFGAGNYSFTITNGTKSGTGSFSIK